MSCGDPVGDGACSMPHKGGISFQHRRDCPADLLDVARIVWPRKLRAAGWVIGRG